MSALRKATAKFIAPIEEAELACRLFEAVAYAKRPAGMTAAQALATLDAEDLARWRRAAHAAMDYWRECIAAAQRPS